MIFNPASEHIWNAVLLMFFCRFMNRFAGINSQSSAVGTFSVYDVSCYFGCIFYNGSSLCLCDVFHCYLILLTQFIFVTLIFYLPIFWFNFVHIVKSDFTYCDTCHRIMVCLSVWLSVTLVHPARTIWWSEMLFGRDTCGLKGNVLIIRGFINST